MSSVRRCATVGCLGTLPARTGKHCPRCGGTVFLPRRRRGWRVLLVPLAVLGIIFGAKLLRTNTGLPSTATPDRQALVEAHDVAAQMTAFNARDTAYAEILHRALAQHDFEYACQLGDEMTQMSTKDKCLLETVEEALKAHQPEWAKRAAGEIVEFSIRDDAFKKIMDSASAK